MEKLQVGVVFGGRSVEHEVSIISALQAIQNLPQERYQAVPIYISKKGAWYTGDALLQLANYRDLSALLAQAVPVYFSPNYGEWQLTGSQKGGLFAKPWQTRLDVMLPVIHGSHGEDGCLQGLLELSGIPYVGPGVLGAACGMDKIIMKAVLKENGLPVLPYVWFGSQEWYRDEEAMLARIEAALPYPLVVKPADLGSSIGISRVRNQEELAEGISLAASFANRIVVEQAVEPLRELNCAILGGPEDVELSAIEEPLAASELLSFGDKYLSAERGKGMGGAKRRIPAEISAEKAAEVQELTKRAFYLFEPVGKQYAALLDDLIRLALQRYRVKEKTVYTYASNILAQGGFKGKK